jgi:hypothetical protein
VTQNGFCKDIVSGRVILDPAAVLPNRDRSDEQVITKYFVLRKLLTKCIALKHGIVPNAETQGEADGGKAWQITVYHHQQGGRELLAELGV